jgi:hypothetical protein
MHTDLAALCRHKIGKNVQRTYPGCRNGTTSLQAATREDPGRELCSRETRSPRLTCSHAAEHDIQNQAEQGSACTYAQEAIQVYRCITNRKGGERRKNCVRTQKCVRMQCSYERKPFCRALQQRAELLCSAWTGIHAAPGAEPSQVPRAHVAWWGGGGCACARAGALRQMTRQVSPQNH